MLTIDIHSFSYKKKGIPQDLSGNGGGFIFDCRGILNPGRIDKYKILTGAHKSVQDFLETKTTTPIFLSLIHQTLSITIENYLLRDFCNLLIGFGCTGGQHRSVYCAIKTAEFIKQKYPKVIVNLCHDEQPQLS